MNRREFLELSVAIAATLAWARGAARESQRREEDLSQRRKDAKAGKEIKKQENSDSSFAPLRLCESYSGFLPLTIGMCHTTYCSGSEIESTT